MNFNIDLTEKELEDFLMENISKYHDNIKVIKRQFRTEAGVIDILAKDISHYKRYIVIELKIGSLDSDAVCQVLRYTQYLNSEKSKNGERMFYPLLIGSSLSDDVSKLLVHYDGDQYTNAYCHYDLFNFGVNGLKLRYYNVKNKAFFDEHYKYHFSHYSALDEELEYARYKLYLTEKDGGKND